MIKKIQIFVLGFKYCMFYLQFYLKGFEMMTMAGSRSVRDNTKQVINGHNGVQNDKPSPILFFGRYKPQAGRSIS